jgi:hypothetical protein
LVISPVCRAGALAILGPVEMIGQAIASVISLELQLEDRPFFIAFIIRFSHAQPRLLSCFLGHLFSRFNVPVRVANFFLFQTLGQVILRRSSSNDYEETHLPGGNSGRAWAAAAIP